ncbi:MAG: RagB/SusD family nutrient uptake outer membrane protein [Bacteroidales bacterium]|nr:RagB/SusD family nutrient uptake outer membrane protein [Bacteroidales bacterium]
MKYRTRTILLLFAFSLLAACNEWLELIPPQGLIRQEFWKTKEDVQTVVMGAYLSMASMDDMLFRYGELRADMVVGDVNLGSGEPGERMVAESNIYPDNWLCNWSSFYQVINYCNEVIKNAPLVRKIDNTFTDYQLKSYLSEATFLRSLAYFYLVRIFKDVPYVTEPTETDDTEVYPGKMDGEELLRLLLIDLEEARKYATTDGYQTLDEIRGRATKAAIDALMADIALWLFEYEDVITCVERIEASDQYLLLPSARWFELFYPGNSLEGIFEFQFNDNLNQSNSLYGMTQRFSYSYDPSQKAIEMFGVEFAKEFVRGQDGSIRKVAEDDYIIWKYVGRNKTDVRSGSIQNSCNWIVYRLADVLLMKAEALSQLGRYAEALEIINDIRKRADVTSLVLPDSPTAYEDAILQERALELAFEGKRWFDLVRMGRRNDYSRKSQLIEIIVSNVPSTQKRIIATKLTNPLGWYLPIAESEIERNPNLVQNPYYIF